MADNDRSGWSGAERRKKKEERRQSNGLQSCFPTSPSLLFLLETKVPECGGKRVNGTQMAASSEMWSFHNQLWFGGAMSSAGVSDLCFLKSSVNAAVYQDILECFMVPAADQLFGHNEFIFQQDLALPHSAKIHTSMVWELPRTCVRLACQLTSLQSHQKFMGDCEKEVA